MFSPNPCLPQFYPRSCPEATFKAGINYVQYIFYIIISPTGSHERRKKQKAPWLSNTPSRNKQAPKKKKRTMAYHVLNFLAVVVVDDDDDDAAGMDRSVSGVFRLPPMINWSL